MLNQKEKKVIEKSLGTLPSGDFGQDAVADAIADLSRLQIELVNALYTRHSKATIANTIADTQYAIEKVKVALGISDGYVSERVHNLVVEEDKRNIERSERLKGLRR